MELSNLRPAEGSKHSDNFRRGRGHGSGNGKTAGKGHKGQKARSGAPRVGFEGGQMPAFRRLPKLKGFNKIHALNTAEINVSALEKIDVSEIDLQYLKENKLVHSSCEVLRVLGNGEISKAVTVKASYVTESAKEKIEKAGGKVELV